METKQFHTLLYAVGSLPFWTGERKLKQFLKGKAGSFWKDPKPLKPTYLNHHFFGGLEDESASDITRALQRLKRTGYLEKDRLSASLPHQVIKLTGKGVFQYYNLLVTEEELTEPAWWIHHLARLQRQPNQPIRTGGELIEFSGRLYLSQTPGFVEPEARVKDDGSIRIVGKKQYLENLNPGQTVFLENTIPVIESGVELGVGEPPEIRSLPSSDLRRKLTHFQPRESMPGDPNPYVLRGKLAKQETGADGRTKIWLRNENREVVIQLEPNQVDDEMGLQEGEKYVLGPVKRDPEQGDQLILKPTGEIQKYEPFN